jgi:hypothetical protein
MQMLPLKNVSVLSSKGSKDSQCQKHAHSGRIISGVAYMAFFKADPSIMLQ